ncbi:hypothetical protein SAMN05192574_102228 [Mucilaginibacter gossypiicola]|uniref:Uncharacterized protein n=1 Tax=Mucilaginibacter gossypiicola TaxID=551995 RepID=A0A1H8D6M9_9SPHI|nr:hypothetical protein [Mucilaginibacter gossypiicola]SEN02846.1 hypothetical protein SAMN05192574_102228 [Mucilaginibacter gossypiicola]
MLNNPALLQIIRDDGQGQTIDIFPVYRQEGDLYVATHAYRIYKGYPAEEGEDFEERLEKYLEYVELEGEANPGFLGELHFNGLTAFEWKYIGNRLSEAEILQVVDVLQDNQPVFLSGNDSETVLSFTFDRFHERKYIQLMADEGRFLVFINGGFSAEIELMEDDWEITGGGIDDQNLLAEILRRIRTHS